MFVMNSLVCGGAEKSLISLLETLDYSKYDVDLFLFKHDGLFMNNIPRQVNLLEEPSEYKYFDMSFKTAFMDCIRKGKFRTAWARLCAGYIFKTEGNRARCEQRVWKYSSRCLKSLDCKYDAAIGFLEKNPIYFCVDKVSTNKKMGFIHTDYDKLGMDSNYDFKYFNELSYIVTVSDECAKVLTHKFPMFKHKIEVIHNIVSPNAINKMSLVQLDGKHNGIELVSVGRLSPEKGFDMSVQACEKLIDSGYNIKWYVLGEGTERQKLSEMIRVANLEETFILLGNRENPYPYIRRADLYVQPSRYEGKSIAIDEAKILHKPIIITRFSTAEDQIIHGENGWIVDMNSDSLYAGISRLIEDEILRKKLKQNLYKEVLGTESEINKLYQLIN